MNALLWIFQILLALHTIMGAVWKFTNPSQSVSSLSLIPHWAWITMSCLELLCGLGLILPVFIRRLGILAPISATYVLAEMLLFCGLFISSGASSYGHLIYWLVVAVISAFVAYGRFVLKPV